MVLLLGSNQSSFPAAFCSRGGCSISTRAVAEGAVLCQLRVGAEASVVQAGGLGNRFLQRVGGPYSARVVRTADEIGPALVEWAPHLAVVDMDIEASGILERLGHHTAQGDRLPVVALTRRGDLKAKLGAFERGVDDILTVPFSPEEFVARVLAIMRRTYRDAIVFTPTLHFGDLEIGILNRRVRAGETELHLTPLEQSLLYLLASRAGRIVSREDILDAIWGTDFVAESNVVDRHVRSLRIKLQNDYRHPRFIATVPGEGYRFIPTFSNTGWGGSPKGDALA